MVKVAEILYQYDGWFIEFNSFCNPNTDYMLFYKTGTQWKYLKDIWLISIDVTCGVSWGACIKTLYSTDSSWRTPSIAYFHSPLFLFWFICFCLQLVLVSTDVNTILFVLDLHVKYTVDVVPLCTYIVCFVILW